MAYQFTQTGQELQNLIDRIYQLADEYDSAINYAVGDYCSHEGKLYKCTAATTGTFDASKWDDSIFVLDEVDSLDTRLTTAENTLANVGTSSYPDPATATLAASTYTEILNVSLAAGTWVIAGNARFENVAAGLRVLGISNSSTSVNALGTQQIYQSSGLCVLNPVRILSFSTTTTVYLVAYSSVACDVDRAYIRAVRII